jgi:adenylate kinase
MTPRTIFFIGKPGCGKGTQARILSEKTGWSVLASGDQFREIAKEDSSVGRKVKLEMDQGLLAPPWFAMYIYLKSLFSVHEDTSIIFDGFNRKEDEARLIIDSLAWLNRTFSVIEISVSDEEIMKRLEGRKAVQGRADDHYVEKRIEEYNTYTTKSLKIFEDSGTLIRIDGQQTPEQVAADIQKALAL